MTRVSRFAVALLFFAVLASACTKQQLVVVTRSAADACEVVQVISDNGIARGVCLAIDALDHLLESLKAAETMGVGVIIVVRRPDGGEERINVAPAQVAVLAEHVGAIRTRR